MYPSAGALLDAADGRSPCNIAVLVGHCSARAGITGFDGRDLTPAEGAQMLGAMEQSLKEGACGVSLGLMYEPGLYVSIEELKKVARLAERYDLSDDRASESMQRRFHDLSPALAGRTFSARSTSWWRSRAARA